MRPKAKGKNAVQILELEGMDLCFVKFNFNVISPLTTFIYMGSYGDVSIRKKIAKILELKCNGSLFS